MADETKESSETLARQVAETPASKSAVVTRVETEKLAPLTPGGGQLDSYRQAIEIANKMLAYAFKQKIGKALRFGKSIFLDGDMALSIAKNIPTFDVECEKNLQTGLAFWKEYDAEDGSLTFFAQATARWGMMDKKMEGVVGSASTADGFWRSKLEGHPEQRSRVYQDMISAAQKRAKRRAIVQVLGLAGITEAKLKELGLTISEDDSVKFRGRGGNGD